MHLRDDLLVEFVTPGAATPTIPARDMPAELVVTDFHRQAMPIVRLRTGDLVDELVTSPCPCGRPSPRINRIIGRANEITKVKGMFVVPRQIQDILHRNGIERRFRLVVDRVDGGRDELTLEIEGDALDDADALKTQAESALRLRIGLKLVGELPANGPRLVDARLQRLNP
jgi:phenylacetate-CoA ligase